jgi:aldose 1-epimerase
MQRYQLTIRPQNGAVATVLQDHLRRAEAVLYPELGNNCLEFRTTPDPDGTTASGEECLPVDVFVPTNDLDSLRSTPFHSGQPLLFPFPNRVRQGIFTFEGTTYQMAGLLARGWDRGAGQAIHGLVADKAWTVENATADAEGARVRAFLQLNAFPDIFEQYPFVCRITVTYTLRNGVLEMRTEVKNGGDKTLPMGFGIHPWFPVALRPGVRLPEGMETLRAEQRRRAQVHVPATALWKLEDLMPTGEILPAEGVFALQNFAPLEDHFFDHVFTKTVRREDGWSEGGLRDPETGLEMYLAADGQFREWVLYAPLERHVIALEPYTCVTDAVNLQAQGVDAGLIALPAGETWRGDIHFGLRSYNTAS